MPTDSENPSRIVDPHVGPTFEYLGHGAQAVRAADGSLHIYLADGSQVLWPVGDESPKVLLANSVRHLKVGDMAEVTSQVTSSKVHGHDRTMHFKGGGQLEVHFDHDGLMIGYRALSLYSEQHGNMLVFYRGDLPR